MRIVLAVVGRLKQGPERELAERYRKRAVDAGDVIVHVFRPEVRAFYNLEKMWAPARPHGRRAS